MATPPEEIEIFSTAIDQNEGQVCSKEISPLNPSAPSDENPKATSPNQEAHSNQNQSDDPSSSHGENPKPCTNLDNEPVGKSIVNPVTCSENPSHSTKKSCSFSPVEGRAEEATRNEEVIASAGADLRNPPARASNQGTEDENGRCYKSEIQAEKVNGLPLLTNLQEVIEAFSGDFDEKRYADKDTLEIAEMMGIVFENPSWWSSEGYSDSL
jgi:hypothetical protein